MVTTTHYAPLDAEGHFRILVLEPALDFSDVIKASLIETRVEEHLPYEALSYAWGRVSDREQGTIKLDGTVTKIALNLENALRHLRLQQDTRFIWVDALCINQNDLEERSSQVRFMKDIYATCTRDLLWLDGVDNDGSSDAIKAMYELGTISNALDLLGDDEHRERVERKLLIISNFFYRSQVWSRAWVTQEVAVAPQVLIVVGNISLDWSQVESFLDSDTYFRRFGIPNMYHAPYSHWFSWRGHLNNRLAIPQILSHQRRLSKTVNDGGHKTGSSLRDVLARFHNTSATDPRDKVYSFLGLTPNPLGIIPDYGRSVRNTFIEASKQIIHDDGSLDLICQGSWGSYEGSWIPNFGASYTANIMFAQRDIFDAGGSRIILPLQIAGDGVLSVEGKLLDSLKEVRQSRAGDEEFSVLLRVFALMPSALLRQAVRHGNGSLGQLVDRSALARITSNHAGIREESSLFPVWIPSPENQESYQTKRVSTETKMAEKKAKKQAKKDAKDTNMGNVITTQKEVTFEDFWRTVLLDCRRSSGLLQRLQPVDIKELGAEFERARMTPVDELSDVRLEPRVRQKLLRNIDDWTFTTTKGGRPGMATKSAQVGDLVVIFRGAKVPVLLRPHKGPAGNDLNKPFTWIGPCYVHGFMNGQGHSGENSSQGTREILIR